jgi:AcrR family transcriptional regulator
MRYLDRTTFTHHGVRYARQMQRARSAEDKAHRSETLLAAAEAVALELGGIRHVTLAAVTEQAGLHRTGVRRYYASKEELLLELAERGWGQWRDAVLSEVGDRTGLTPAGTAATLSTTLTALPVFCDLLTHVPLTLEGDVALQRAHRYKTNAFAAHDEIVATLAAASTMTTVQLQDLIATALALSAYLWQLAHPTPTLAALYDQVPEWGHVALDFAPRLRDLLKASASGLADADADADAGAGGIPSPNR